MQVHPKPAGDPIRQSSAGHAPEVSLNRRLTLVALLTAFFMTALETTIVATALPTVVADLGQVELYAWVSSGYLLATVVTMPVFGKLADIKGRKPLLLVGLLLFLLGSLASGFASSMPLLVAARVVHGLGAGSIQPLAMTIVGDLYRLEERGKVQGLFAATWAAAGVLGPLLGGVIVQSFSWSWIFWLNIPFVFGSIALLLAAYQERAPASELRLDVRGALLLALACAALVIGTSGVRSGLCIGVGTIAALGFVASERRASDPLIPLDLLGQRLLGSACAMCAMLGAVMMGVVVYVPLFVEGVLGGGARNVAGSLGPMLIAGPLASALCSRAISLLGEFRVTRAAAGLVLFGALLLLLATSGKASNVWQVGASTFVLGLGFGLGNTSLLLSVQHSVGWEQRGTATASMSLSRTLAGAMAVGGLGVLATAGVASVTAGVASVTAGGESLRSLFLRDAGLERGLHSVFVTLTLLSAGTLVCSWWVPRTT